MLFFALVRRPEGGAALAEVRKAPGERILQEFAGIEPKPPVHCNAGACIARSGQ
ncbi:hypothetical protein [Uliginosibacterium sp. 31-12]|jgi:hypothetical protein|uniref:hypothetical protein n=1 Tax=Uliginosibacterium sp. 31-12 TaxID=3062781 RepID=UPI0026E46CDD|nr:hypothetical protein [Uliginosibacterium sp. 31-12]